MPSPAPSSSTRQPRPFRIGSNPTASPSGFHKTAPPRAPSSTAATTPATPAAGPAPATSRRSPTIGPPSPSTAPSTSGQPPRRQDRPHLRGPPAGAEHPDQHPGQYLQLHPRQARQSLRGNRRNTTVSGSFTDIGPVTKHVVQHPLFVFADPLETNVPKAGSPSVLYLGPASTPSASNTRWPTTPRSISPAAPM